jgi:copper chaperone CopZ
MQKLTIELPTMYGDHHVVEVRKILLGLVGVQEVYASSAFHVVEITFDAEKLSDEVIIAALDRAGYTGELNVPVEQTAAVGKKANGQRGHFRHTAAYAASPKSVSFTRIAPYLGRPMWPCPGFGPMDMPDNGGEE